LLACLVLAAACAVVEPPPGGPVDMTPPHLVFMIPDSAATGLGDVTSINLTFSEKMDRTSAVTWLHFFPDQRIRKTKWSGATVAEIILETPLPPDTVIVVEVISGMRDAHKVKSTTSRRFPIATADSLPGGRIRGVLIMGDSAVTKGVVELYDIPPDTMEYFQQSLLRRTATDETGTFTFDWLPVPGGPWLMRAFADADDNLRPGDKEAQRLMPDTLSLSSDQPTATARVTTLYAWDTPGRLIAGPFAPAALPGTVRAFALAVAEDDTGWVPVTDDGSRNTIVALDPAGGSIIPEVRPGAARVVLFVDVDGDSTFSAVPDSLLSGLPDSLAAAAAGDSLTAWFLEPWWLAEGIEVTAGMDRAFDPPSAVYNLTPGTKPTAPDSLSAFADTTTTPPDSLAVPQED
jgi:hypothetical protein